ncbi:MAG: ribonuclease R, partial [Ruminococcus sp.]|nr:ribonuclease R [Ruminococcus sp.]
MKKKNNSSNKTDIETYKKKIITFLQTYNKKTMPISELENKCRTKKQGRDNFINAFDQLRTEGIITVRKGMKTGLCSRLNIYPAVVTRLSRTFGFAKTDDGTEYFIPGKCMLGAMPNDRVLVSDIPSRSGEPEGEII